MNVADQQRTVNGFPEPLQPYRTVSITLKTYSMRGKVVRREVAAGKKRVSPLDGDWPLGRVEVDLVERVPPGLPVEVIGDRAPKGDGIVERLLVQPFVFGEAVDVRPVHAGGRKVGRFVIKHWTQLRDLANLLRGFFHEFSVRLVDTDHVLATVLIPSIWLDSAEARSSVSSLHDNDFSIDESVRSIEHRMQVCGRCLSNSKL